MYEVDFNEEFLTKVNNFIDAVNDIDYSEFDEMIDLLNKRISPNESEALIHLGVKAAIKMASMYRNPEKARKAFAAFEAVMNEGLVEKPI